MLVKCENNCLTCMKSTCLRCFRMKGSVSRKVLPWPQRDAVRRIQAARSTVLHSLTTRKAGNYDN